MLPGNRTSWGRLEKPNRRRSPSRFDETVGKRWTPRRSVHAAAATRARGDASSRARSLVPFVHKRPRATPAQNEEAVADTRRVASHKSVLDTPQRVRLWTIPSRPNTTTNPAAAIGGSGGGGGGGGPAIVRLEQLNPTMESGNIFEVHVKVGDTVSEDDVLYSIDLDKVWVDIHSPVAGTVTMLADIDTDCMVGEVIATISSARLGWHHCANA